MNQSEQLIGCDELVQDAKGSWQIVSKPGRFERATRPVVESAGSSIRLVAIVSCLLIGTFSTFQLYKWRRR